MVSHLGTDHVNYLIWRYLQESGYGRTAVQLARDWNSDPQQLPFVNAVKPHTLISMLQDGLAYDNLVVVATDRRSAADKGEATVSAVREEKYSFIMNRKRRASDGPTVTSSDSTRKRPRLETVDTQQSTPDVVAEPVRRPKGRKKSTAVKALVETETVTESVDSVTAPASPVEHSEIVIDEPAPLVSTLEIGTSTGAQNEPTPEATTILDTRIPDAEILGISWSRSSPSRLTATGSSVWKSWIVPPINQPDSGPETELKTIDYAADYGKCFISATASAKANEAFALAVERKELNAEVIVQTVAEKSGEDSTHPSVKTTVLCSNSQAVLALRWSDNSNRLLVLSAKNGRCKVTAWDTSENRLIGEYNLRETSFDLAWVQESQFVICGDKFLALASLEPKLSLLKYVEHAQELTALRWDRHTQRVACISHDAGTIQMIDTKLFTIDTGESQDGAVTACEWQPLVADYISTEPRILATSSHTGTINIWDGRSKLQLLHKVVMDSVPAMVLAFSPDGQLLAGAGDDKICIWKTSMAESKPFITWEPTESATRQEGAELVDQMDIDQAEEEERWRIGSLSWNASGAQLAYSNADKLRVIAIAP